jgi:hypothetical protein
MDVNEVYACFKQLKEKGETHAIYYLLYLVFATLEMDMPYLFLAVGEEEAELARYIDKFSVGHGIQEPGSHRNAHTNTFVSHTTL